MALSKEEILDDSLMTDLKRILGYCDSVAIVEDRRCKREILSLISYADGS